MKKIFLLILVASLFILNIPVNAANNWPEKSIQVIVPWAPGGGSDLSARIVLDKASEYLGQPIVITNITGAAGLNGALRVNKARPDGYTILWEHPANLAIAPYIGRAKYTWKDFDMGCSIGTSDTVVFVKKDSPWNNMKDLITAMKSNPGKVKWSVGVNSASHFILLAMKEAVGGFDVMLIPGAGDKTRIINVMGNVCDVTVAGYAAVAPYVDSGDVKILGICSNGRSAIAPQFPTLQEQGIDVTSEYLYTAEFPKNTPQKIKEKFYDAVQKSLLDSKVQDLLKKQCITVKYRDSAETTAIWEKEGALYMRLAKENKLIH